jgi:putative transposase
MLDGFRLKRTYVALRSCLAAARERARHAGYGRVVHYAVMPNHVHLVLEASDRDALSRGIQGLATRIARALNRLWKRSGRLFADRYHARALTTPREVRHALAYVLGNARHHRLIRPRVPKAWVDPYTSGASFDGWRIEVSLPRFEIPVAPARTWLLTKGWRRHGLLDPSTSPG